VLRSAVESLAVTLLPPHGKSDLRFDIQDSLWLVRRIRVTLVRTKGGLAEVRLRTATQQQSPSPKW